MIFYLSFGLLARLQKWAAIIFFVNGFVLLIAKLFDPLQCPAEVRLISNENKTAQQVTDYCTGKLSPFIIAKQDSTNNFNLSTFFFKLFVISIYNWICVFLWSRRKFVAKKRRNVKRLFNLGKTAEVENKSEEKDENIFTVKRLKETIETPDLIFQQLLKYLWFCLFFLIYQFYCYFKNTFLFYLQKRSFFIVPNSFGCSFIEGFYRPERFTSECTLNLNILHNLIFHIVHYSYLLLIIVNLILIIQLIILSFSKCWRLKIIENFLPEVDQSICKRLSVSSRIFFVLENLAGKELQKLRNLIDELIKEHSSDYDMSLQEPTKQNEIV